MKKNASKKIVCSLLIGLLQFGGSAFIVEAAAVEDIKIQQQDRHEQEGYWREQHKEQERILNERRMEELIRHEQALRLGEQESEREWRYRQWAENQRLQQQNEERIRRQWWENQRYEEAMRRLAYESEREWQQRQWLENQRHEQAMREIEIAVLGLAIAFGK